MWKRYFRPLPYKDLAKQLESFWCVCIRRKQWSHAQFCRIENEAIFDVPDHGSTVILPKTIDYILKKAKIDRKDFWGSL